MPDDARTVPVTLDVDHDTATALQDPAVRARIGRHLSGLVRSETEAQRPPAPDTVGAHTRPHAAPGNIAAPDDLVGRFRAFAARHTLRGLAVKDLIDEGRR